MTDIKAIAAVSQNGVIGKNGNLPWRIPGELKWFKKITMGHIMVMGRKTWDSLPGILPGRENWILSSTLKAKKGIKIFSSFESALNEAGARTIFIIGGGQIYSSLLPQCSELYITEVQQFIEEGDAFFPSFEKDFTPTETLEENKEFIIKKWKRITS